MSGKSRSLANRRGNAIAFNARYARITANTLGFFKSREGRPVDGTQRSFDTIWELTERYNELKNWIDENIDQAGQRELSRLATLARRLMQAYAKGLKEEVSYDAEQKTLQIGQDSFDFR